MATASKTVSWAFATRITTLATNTTLATATRHDFAAITIDMPELTRTIRSVRLRVTCRDTYTALNGVLGWRLGIKLGAVAFDDVDYAPFALNYIGHETLIVERDVTAYFLTNFGSGASQTCQVGVAFSHSTAASANNLTAELHVTYDYDNTAATHVKTIEIPIQGHYTTLTTSDIEIGTTGGVSDAAANQIPNLSTFCPEASKTFKQIYLRVTAHDYSTTGTGDTTLSLKLDSGGTYDARAVCKHAIGVGAQYRDIVDLTVAPYSITTNAVHALIAKSNLASNSFANLSAVLVVTYTFTVSGTTRELHSCRSVVANDRGTTAMMFGVLAADGHQYVAQLEVQEPGTITMLQSGVVVFDQNQVALSSFVNATGQGARATVIANISFGTVSCAGTRIYTRRCDHDSSAWALVRGTNRLAVNVRASLNITPSVEFSGYAIVNYTADIPAQGIGSGNRSCGYSLVSHTAFGDYAAYVTAADRIPSFPSTPWMLSSAWCDLGIRAYSYPGISYSLGVERQTGEDCGDGWYQDEFPASGGNVITGTPQWSRRETMRPIAQWIRRSSFGRVGMELPVSRRWRLGCAVGTGHHWSASQWITLHDIAFTVAGAVAIGGVAAADGGTVKIYADDGVSAEYITSVTIAGGAGAFTAQVCDSTRNYFATYNDGTSKGWSGFGTPGTSTFDIAVGLTVGVAFASRRRIPMQTLKLSTADDVRFTMRSSTTGALLAGLTVFVVSLCKKGGTSHATITPTITDLGGGLYNMALTTAHTNTLGVATIIVTSTGAMTNADIAFDVVAVDRNDAAAWGMTNLDAAISTRAAATALTTAQTDLTTLTGRLTSGRATAIDNLDATVSSRAPSSTALSSATWTPTRAGLVDNLDAAITTRAAAAALATTQADTDDIQTRLTTLQADTDDIQARLPAALVGGKIAADVGSWLGTAVHADSVAGFPSVVVALVATNALGANSIADGAITAAKFSTNAINANALASDAVAEIQSGIATTAALTTAQTDLTTLTGRLTSGRATAIDNLDATVTSRASAAAVATLQADTDDIQTRLPAALDASGNMKAAVQSIVTGVIDTVVATVFSFVIEAGGPVGSRTFLERLRIQWSLFVAKASGLGITAAGVEHFRDAADTKDRATFTLALDGTRIPGTLDGG